MKYTTVAALLTLASAANIDARQATDLTYTISDFTAACTTENTFCFYGLSIVTSNNPDFTQSCDVSGTSDSGDLPAVSETRCGTYTVSVAKSDNGGLLLTVNSGSKPSLTGTFTLSSNDLTTTTVGESKVQEYIGVSTFTIDIKNADATSTPTTSSGSSAPSSTGTTTSASPSETNGGTRESAFTSVLLSIGLMAFMF